MQSIISLILQCCMKATGLGSGTAFCRTNAVGLQDSWLLDPPISAHSIGACKVLLQHLSQL